MPAKRARAKARTMMNPETAAMFDVAMTSADDDVRRDASFRLRRALNVKPWQMCPTDLQAVEPPQDEATEWRQSWARAHGLRICLSAMLRELQLQPKGPHT